MKDLKDQSIGTNTKKIPNKKYNENDYIRELLDASYQGVKRLFVIEAVVVLIELQLILTEDTFLKENKLKITLKLMEQIFMISHSMT